MDLNPTQFESECQASLDRFFAARPDAATQKRANKALRMLRSTETPLKGNAQGWAAGVIYAMYNDGHVPCGVPGVLNAEFEQLMGTTMGTARYRAARVVELITL